jgi:hypothetical protein
MHVYFHKELPIHAIVHLRVSSQVKIHSITEHLST